ncbi:MAG: ATP-binding protein [Eubacterium sp.]|nr:ATP-binding protein [Eubacterium sp.]MBR0119872.1 ATP-binding protein [Eubacterium sp.]
MKELDIPAQRENLSEVLKFIDVELEQLGCSMRLQTAIDVAVEEIFVNISSYAYDPEVGQATIRVDVSEDPLTIEIGFIDSGTPYDPLAKPDPNTKIPIRERKKGGLGIYMVKKSMDDISYEYKDGKNILTIKKMIS